LPIALAARKVGYEVHVATANGVAVQRIKNFGFFTTRLPLQEAGKTPSKSARSKTNPDLKS